MDALLGLGIALIKKSEYEKALTHLLQAKSKDPERGDIRFQLALCYDLEGRRRQAAEEYQESIRIDPTLPEEHRKQADPHIAITRCQLQRGRQRMGATGWMAAVYERDAWTRRAR